MKGKKTQCECVIVIERFQKDQARTGMVVDRNHGRERTKADWSWMDGVRQFWEDRGQPVSFTSAPRGIHHTAALSAF